MITLQGAISGILAISPISLSFKSKIIEEGKQNPRQINKYKNKIWKLECIKEMVVKRYGLTRQAVEIYFDNSKSAFFSVFSQQCLKNFLINFKAIMEKRKDLAVSIVTSPEKHFFEKKYRLAWKKSNISNFEYLMLLNKYSGRSFHDINQYPIFPWIISNYETDQFALEDTKNYRDLHFTILGITPNKRHEAGKRLDESLKFKDPCQSCFYYLQGEDVLGYLFRLEPYSSLMNKREHGKQTTKHRSIAALWQNELIDSSDNKELIPEYYYLFDLFKFSKRHSSEIKDNYVNCAELSMKNALVLPNWAKNQHHFVKINTLALESNFTSSNLHHWIDMIFGFNQQDPRIYNRVKSLCDEKYIKKKF